jgi:chorismate mutase/prephenate dehydratase
MATDRHELDELRAQMDQVDNQLLELLHGRAKLARRLGELRKGQPATLPVVERVSARKLVAKSAGPMPEESLRDILREVHAACLALELPVKVAYCGLEGGPSAVATKRRFGQWSNLVACSTASLAFEEVAKKRAEFAVVPFETSSEGPVNATIAALVASELKVIEVLEAPVELQLLSLTGNAADIEKVYATAADRALCQQGFAAAGLRATSHDVRSPLFACQLASEDPSSAAIAVEAVGAHFGLTVAQRGLEGTVHERVRFAVVGARPSARSGEDYTSIAFSVPDTPGALLDVLKQFAERGVSLTKVHSRPVPGDGWSYLFLVELAGHATDRPVITALEEIKRLTKMLRVLGSYPVP